MTSVTLKIDIVDKGVAKSLMFNTAMPVDDAMKLVQEKLEAGGADFGLFLVEHAESGQGRWLESGKTLAYYDLQNGMTLRLKRKRSALRVKLPDDSTKVVLVDETQTVTQIVKAVCDKAMISTPEEYLLQFDGQWLDANLSMAEQNVVITNETVLILGKRLHFYDNDIDRSDPIALNLLYVQARDAILHGTHPVTKEEAVQFAALMCQVLYGNHDPTKHKKGFVMLEDMLPRSYAVVKDIEKDIFKEHRKLIGMSELNAKYRYMQLCRSLKTYGVTFFAVKEQTKDGSSKKHLKPILLGITRESVLRMDPDTKAVVHHYPLTHLRRWAPAPGTFTFDFGDYEDAYYTVMTDQGDEISQLLAQYIDMQRKEREKKMATEQNEQQAAFEDNVGGAMGVGVTGYAAGKMRTGESADAGGPGAQSGVRGGAQVGKRGLAMGGNINATGVLGVACQREIESALASSRMAAHRLSDDLPAADYIALDPAAEALRMENLKSARLRMQQALKASAGATATVLNQLAGATDIKQVDTAAVAAAFKVLADYGPMFADACKLAANNAGNDDAIANALWNAARDLMNATSKLILSANISASTLAAGNLDARAREDLIAAGQAIGAATSLLLVCASCQEVDPGKQQKLLDAARALAQATAVLVQGSKLCAGKLSDPDAQQNLVNAAKGSATAASTLLAVTKSTAAAINFPACQRQLLSSAANVEGSAESLLALAAQIGADSDSLNQLMAAKNGMLAALQALRDAVVESCSPRYDDLEKAANAIKVAILGLQSAGGNPEIIVQHAKGAAQAVNALVAAAKLISQGEPDPLIQQQFIQAAKAIADAAHKLLVAASIASKNPEDASAQDGLKDACLKLDTVVSRLLGDVQRKQAFQTLADVSKKAIDTMGMLMTSGKNAVPLTQNATAQKNLDTNVKGVSITTGKLLQAVNSFNENPRDPQLQTQLVLAAKGQLGPSTKLLQSVQAAAPSVNDVNVQGQFVAAAKSAGLALQSLSKALKTANEATGFIDVDAAVESTNACSADVDAVMITASMDMLEVDKSVASEKAQSALKAAATDLAGVTANLLNAASRAAHEEVGPLAKATAAALQALVGATRVTATTTASSDAQMLLLGGAKNASDVCSTLLQVCKQALATPMDPANNDKLAAAAKQMQTSLGRLVTSVPGVKECEDTLQTIKKAVGQLNMAALPTPPPGLTFAQSSEELSAVASELSNALTAMVMKARGSSDIVAEAAKAVADMMPKYVMQSQLAAAMAGDIQSQGTLLAKAQELAQTAAIVFAAAKAVATNQQDDTLHTQLIQAAKGVSELLGQLQNTVKTCYPGMRDCDESIEKITSVKAVLSSRPEVPVGANYFAVAEQIQKSSKELATAAAAMITASKNALGKEDVMGRLAKEAAAHLAALTAATAVAAGLAGGVPAGPSKTAIDNEVAAIEKAADDIKKARSPAEVLQNTAAAARTSSALVNEAKALIAVEKDPAKKKNLINASKAAAMAMNDVVTAAKAIAQDPSNPENQKNLIRACDGLKTGGAELGKACKGSVLEVAANAEQSANLKALIANANKTAETAMAMVTAAKALAASPKDATLQGKLTMSARGVSEAISSLNTTVKSAAPGMKDCESSLSSVQNAINDLDAAHINATIGQLAPKPGVTLASCQEEVMGATGELASAVKAVIDSANVSASDLGRAALTAAGPMSKITKAAIAAASNTSDPEMQQELLNLTKGVCEQMSTLVNAARASAMAPLDKELSAAVADQELKFNTTMSALVNCVRKGVSSQRECDVAKEEITRAVDTLKKPSDAAGVVFSKAQVQVADSVKELLKAVTAMQMQARTEPEKLGAHASKVSACLAQVIGSTRVAGGAIKDSAVLNAVLGKGKDVATACAALVDAAKQVSLAPKDATGQAEVQKQTKAVQSMVSELMNSMKEAATGQRECEEAVHVISQHVADLDTQAMFVTGDPIPLSKPDDSFQKYENVFIGIIASVKDVLAGVNDATKDPKALGALSSQVSSVSAALVEQAKLALPTLQDLKSRRDVLNAARELSNNMMALLAAAQKLNQDPTDKDGMAAFAEAQKLTQQQIDASGVLFTRLSTEAMYGTKTCQEVDNMIKDDADNIILGKVEVLDATPEEAVESAKAVAQVTAKLVTATKGNSKQLAEAARDVQRVMNTLLLNCRGAATSAEDENARNTMLQASRTVSEAMRAMLAQIHTAGPRIREQEQQHLLAAHSKSVADCIKGVIDGARAIKGEMFDLDDDDPNSVAERELHSAARAIEAAAKKLAALKPKAKPKEEGAISKMTFEEVIVEASQAIAAATSSLLKSATAQQHELVLQGRVVEKKSKMYHADATWADGLISAAQAVAGATSQLAENANKVVKGGEEFGLIAAAKSVAASTAQLVAASRAKGDPNSETQIKLGNAAKAVRSATDNLVKTAQDTASTREAPESQATGAGKVSMARARVLEMEAQMKVLELEKELEKARNTMSNIHKARYN